MIFLQMLGERLFPLIRRMYPERAGKITSMLLEIDNSELLYMLESQASLKAKVEDAVAVLQAHRAKEAVSKKLAFNAQSTLEVVSERNTLNQYQTLHRQKCKTTEVQQNHSVRI